MVTTKIEREAEARNYGKFVIGPLERGYGITLGNALRRVLLSLLEGTAVTSIRIADVQHEFSDIPGVREDVIRVMQTFGREVNIGTHFAGILYYDGQSFLVPADSRVQQVRDLDGASICVLKESTHVLHLADYFKAHGWNYRPVIVESVTQAKDEFFAGRCQAYTSDASTLASVRVEAPGGPHGFRILPERISKEPVRPVVNRGDEQWFALVKWVLLTLIEAEERGITRATADRAVTLAIARASSDARARADWDYSVRELGLRPDWAVQSIRAVGNYGEMFECNLGAGSPLGLERGLNRLWTQGGLMYAPPLE